MFRPAAAVLALSLSLSACGLTSDDDSVDVVASFYPLAWTAERIAGEHATVENLTGTGQEPHDLELSVRQTATVSSATTAFYIEGFQPAVDEALEQAPDVSAVNAAEFVESLEAEDHEGQEEGQEGGQEHEGEHDHGHAGTGNPHFWLDPTQLAAAADGLAEAMAGADPAHAADYRANAAALRDDLETLDEEFKTGLAKCRTNTIVVSHDAFGYLGARYDLHVVPIAGISPDSEPSAKTLAEISAEARLAGVTTVFAERLASPALANTLADELGVTTAVLDPLEGLAKGDGGDYLSIMRENLDALRTANGCR